jgi:hypothetical protein
MEKGEYVPNDILTNIINTCSKLIKLFEILFYNFIKF